MQSQNEIYYLDCRIVLRRITGKALCTLSCYYGLTCHSSRAAALEAFEIFKSKNPKPPFYEGASGSLEQQKIDGSFEEKSARGSKSAKSSTRLKGALESYATLFGSFQSTEAGSMSLSLSSLLQHKQLSESLTRTLTEISDTIKIGNRELDLSQDPVLYGLVVETNQTMFDILQTFHEYSVLPKYRISLQLKNLQLLDDNPRLSEQVARMRILAEKVLREADYRHRLEMHKASNKITVMHLEQQKMMRMLDDQKRLLESMQEERKIMDVVRDQQKILQVLLQIQMSLPSAPA